jgi:hypothetical protein
LDSSRSWRRRANMFLLWFLYIRRRQNRERFQINDPDVI